MNISLCYCFSKNDPFTHVADLPSRQSLRSVGTNRSAYQQIVDCW